MQLATSSTRHLEVLLDKLDIVEVDGLLTKLPH